MSHLDQMIDGHSEQEVVEQRTGILFKALNGLEICVEHRSSLGNGFNKLSRTDRCLYEHHKLGRRIKDKRNKRSVSFEMGYEALRKLGVIIPYGLTTCNNCFSNISDLVENADDPMSNDIPLSQQSTHSYIGPEDFPESEEMDNLDDTDYQPSQNRDDQVHIFFCWQ